MTVLFKYRKKNYCPFNIIWKDVFTWRFILNKTILFWLTISYQEPFIFFVSALCLQIFAVKLILRREMRLTYAFTMINCIFFNFFIWFFFSFFFHSMILNNWCFITILWKFQKLWTNATSWISASKLRTQSVLAQSAAILTIGKCCFFFVFFSKSLKPLNGIKHFFCA